MLAQIKLHYWFTISLISLTLGASAPAQEISNNNQSGVITVESTSGTAEIALAQHLQQTKAKLYGAYWCSHCYEQVYLFGQPAFGLINRIECAPQGKNAQPEVCQAAKITGFPTWEINGKFYTGVQSLPELANISGYQGTQNFQNAKPVNIPSQYSPIPADKSVEHLKKLNWEKNSQKLPYWVDK
ncbi:hypothetical protein [Nostoc sp. TCL26-01]|uniref:hypothetical protein n=1 Tax=Nostoc sp. TCL26-01 TaxID=2576904 RepID=UPI0015B97AD7|nr:hypothetical protein [Nostoc sp. TCL26-01]QLE58742.1 hypothetical protein FD725_26515 [Nostoc sp. TCL26-01]